MAKILKEGLTFDNQTNQTRRTNRKNRKTRTNRKNNQQLTKTDIPSPEMTLGEISGADCVFQGAVCMQNRAPEPHMVLR